MSNTTTLLRTTSEILDAIKSLAEEHGRSLNKEIEWALKQYISQHSDNK